MCTDSSFDHTLCTLARHNAHRSPHRSQKSTGHTAGELETESERKPFTLHLLKHTESHRNPTVSRVLSLYCNTLRGERLTALHYLTAHPSKGSTSSG